MSLQNQAETPSQTENKLDASKPLPGKFETIANLASSALHSAVYEGVQQPLTSLAQYVDQLKGTHLTEKMQFIAPIKEAVFGTAEWHADQLGAAAGQMLPYLASRYMVKPLFAEQALLSKTAFLSKASPLGFSVAEAATTGFVSQTLFHPVANRDNFWKEKIIDGGKGALTMSTLTATTHGLSFLAEKQLASTLKISGTLKNPIASGIISGAPAGFLGAEMDSIQKDRQFASWSDIAKSVYGMSMVGGTFGAIAYRANSAEISRAYTDKIVEPKGTQLELGLGLGLGEHLASAHKVDSLVSEKVLQPPEPFQPQSEPKEQRQLELRFNGPQMTLDFGEKLTVSANAEPLHTERIAPPPEPPQPRVDRTESKQLELNFPDPLTTVGKRAYALLRHLEDLPADENAKISEGKYPITLNEAQAIRVLLDEWVPGAQRIYNQISARGSVAQSMAYNVWVHSSLSKVKAELPQLYEHALFRSHPDNDPMDRNKFVGHYLERPLGIDSPEEVGKFISAWQRTSPYTRWLTYPGDVHAPTLLKMIRWGHADEIPDVALRPIAEHYRVYGDPFTDDIDIKALIAAAPGWEVSPLVPIDVATKLAAMSPLQKLAADPAVIATRNQFEDTKDSAKAFFAGEEGEAVRAAFFKNVDEISQLSPRAIVKKMQYEDALPLAIDVLHGDSISPEHKYALLQGLNSFRQAPQILAGLDLPTFKDAFDKLIVDNPVSKDAENNERYFDWQARSATILATVFKKNWPKWLDVQQKAGRDNFQATTWLPANEPAEFKGLSQFLLQHGRKSVNQLEKISEAWSEIKGTVKVDDYKEALRTGLLSKYKVINDASFAEEASRWNVSGEKYQEYEKRFIASKDLPSPFPLDEKWSIGNLTGRFIPRDDPRGLFLGDHTNCCQHPGGNGESSAWYGQENPKSGFFVVEDSEGEIVAQSWSVVTDSGGLIFDNVEAKGLEKRQDAVKQIYQQAANSLTSRFHIVTLGTENSDLILAGMTDAGAKTQKMPVEFSGYTDAKNQVLLATSDTVMPGLFEAPMLRGALNLDKTAMSEISKARFPEGWQALPWEPSTRGLVLEHKTDGVLGYALYEPNNRYVSDIAIKPGINPKYGHNLTSNLFRTLRSIGGDWTADMRASTTYRIVQRASKLGHVKIISDTVDDEPMGTEQMHHVVFNVDKQKAKSESGSPETTDSASTGPVPIESQP